MHARKVLLGIALAALALPPLAAEPAPAGVPVTHDPIVPVMHLGAQDLPPGIRPGAWMSAPHNCTMSFVLRDTINRLYITTAGHCVDFVGQRVAVFNAGAPFGTVVARRFTGLEDYALVRIDTDRYGDVNPRMAGFGGPVGMVTGTPTEEVLLLKHYGFGSATWYTHESRCRMSLTDPSFWPNRGYEAHGVVAFGDSGGPILTADGRALGLTNYLSFDLSGVFGGSRLDVAMAWFNAQLGLTLSLVDGGAPTDVCSHT